MTIILTPQGVIDALGGTRACMSLVGAKKHQNIYSWRAEGVPSKFYVLITDALAEKGHTADPKVFGQVLAEDVEAAQ